MFKIERILIIHPHLNIKGGSERFTKVLTQSLIKRGIEVALMTSSYDNEWFGNLKVTWYILDKNVPDKKSHVIEKVKFAIKVFNPDAVIIALQDTYYGYAVKQVKNIPVVMYVHTPIDEEINEENLKLYEEHFRFPLETPKYLKYIDRVLVNSDLIKLTVKQLWDVEPIVVYPCIDEFFINNSISEFDERENIILYVGRFVHLKRQDFLIITLNEVLKDVKDVKVIFAGFKDPRHLPYYEKILKISQECENVKIIESPSDEELLKLYRKAKLYIHVRVSEHFGLSPVEAMLQGALVIIRAPSGLSMVIKHNVHGFIASCDLEVIELTKYLLKKKITEFNKVREEACKWAKQLHPDVMCNKILEIIKSIKP